MQSASSLVEILKTNSELQTDEQCESFRNAIQELSSQPNDTNLLPDLLSIFNNSAQQLSLVWTLIHYIESFDKSALVKALVASTPILLKKARTWLVILYMRILNNEQMKTLVKEVFASSAKNTQDVIRQALEAVITSELIEDQDTRDDFEKKMDSILIF